MAKIMVVDDENNTRITLSTGAEKYPGKLFRVDDLKEMIKELLE